MKQLIKMLHGYRLYFDLNKEGDLYRVNFIKEIDTKSGTQESNFQFFLTPEELYFVVKKFDEFV